MKKKMIVSLIVLAAIIMIWQLMFSSFVVGLRKTDLSSNQWRKDILYLKEELASRHADIDANVSKEEYNRAFDKLLEAVPDLDSDEIAIRLLEAVALIGDSHTAVKNYNTGADIVFPIELYRFKDGYYVIKASEADKDLIGRRLTAINNIAIENIEEKVSELIPHENMYWVYNTISPFMVNQKILKHFNIITDDKASFTFADKQGNVLEAALQADKVSSVRNKLVGKPEASDDSISDEFKLFEKEKVLYINVFRNKHLNYDINDILSKEQYKNAESLIIDLRNHSGGSFFPGSKLVTSIRKNNSLNNSGHLFVITGRDTFSSGLNLAVDIKRNTKAVFYGEPTGGKPAHFGEVRYLKLPNSKISLSYSTKCFASYYKTDSLYPDVEVDLTIDDYLNGIDPVVDRILKNF